MCAKTASRSGISAPRAFSASGSNSAVTCHGFGAAAVRKSSIIVWNGMRATVPMRRLTFGVALAAIAVAAGAEAPSVVFTFQLPGSGNGGRVLAVDAHGNTYAAGVRF